jgi:hypothetical protein
MSHGRSTVEHLATLLLALEHIEVRSALLGEVCRAFFMCGVSREDTDGSNCRRARLGTELQAKRDALCGGTRRCKSELLRQALRVVSVEQLRQAMQESRVEQAEHEAS